MLTYLTYASIRKFTKEVDSEIVTAESEPELLRKLNELGREWQLLRAPFLIRGLFVAVVLKPEEP